MNLGVIRTSYLFKNLADASGGIVLVYPGDTLSNIHSNNKLHISQQEKKKKMSNVSLSHIQKSDIDILLRNMYSSASEC